MRDFIITTDNNADLPEKFYEENGVEVISLTYMIDGEVYDKDSSLPFAEFYGRMRNGSMPTTAQINPEAAKERFHSAAEKGMDVLHIAFSSGLSGSYNSARIAAEEIKEEFPEAEIKVVDSLGASLGQGLLVYKAVEMKKAGKSMEEVAVWLEENKLHACHIFTVDDLHHLYRGGRLSKAAAVFGTMINLKPILHVDNEGKLTPIGKVRGRKKSLMTLVEYMEEMMGSYRDQNDIVFISHGDSADEADFLAEQIKERFGIDAFMIHYVGPTIGAHSGPGTMALFFLGEKR